MIETLRRIPNIGVVHADNADTRLRKRALTTTAVITAIIVTPWTLMYYALGYPQVAAIPTLYIVVTIVTLIVYAKSKDDTFLRYSQLAMFLVLPVFVHMALGGYLTSSAVVLFAAVGPVGAASFADTKRPWPWFIAFAIAVFALVPLDPVFREWAPDLPTGMVIGFTATNITSTALIMFIALLAYVRSRNQLAADLAHERERSDRLLLNVLPPSIAERLKDGEQPIADRHEDVGVLFADIVDFTPLSESLSADDLVAGLNGLFSTFDTLAVNRGLEKVKTIGDAYMVVSGAPDPGSDLADLADLALAMRDAAQDATIGERRGIAMRFGLDVGPIVAGVIGESRFIYDVYGDTVNTASRMESNGIAGQIQVSERAATDLADAYLIEPRGTVDIKGKGATTTYLLIGHRADC